MEELVAGAFLSAVFEKLFEKLASKEFVNLFRGNKSIDDQLKQLKQKLKKASGLLDDAEVRQLDEPKVKEWLDELKDVIYRAQDLMGEIDYEALKSKLERESESSMSFLEKIMKSKLTISSNSEFDKTVQGEMAQILEDLDFLLVDNDVASGLKEGAHENSTTTGSSSQRQVDAPWREERFVHGRSAEKEEIMELLMSNDALGRKIGVLPIVGMGGLGKTTLAHLIYNDDRWKERGFELKRLVTVSTEFDIFKIMKGILTQVNSSSKCEDEKQMLQHGLKEALRGKKFLIVLDDVWKDDYFEGKWDVLKSTFEVGERESRVIVTTRSHTVASKAKTGPIHELQLLDKDHCWKIFIDHAFDGDSNTADLRLQEIGKGIVEKCKGLPLAVKSLGGLLRSVKDPRKWESILKSSEWEGSNEIHPSLWLSYRYLPSCLKQCFAYCSVFPKDYELEKEEIILLWMAEGFLQTDKKGKEMEEVGEEYFENLISRSLFQRSSRNESTFAMHDLVHDLAKLVSGDFCLAVDNKKSLELVANKTRYLSESIDIDDNDSIRESLSRAKHLRSLIGQGLLSSSNELIEELLAGRRCLLRVLSLQFNIWFSWLPKLSSLPNSISKLKHLRYLNLSNSDIEDLPCSICTLYNLQTLLLSECEKLTKLPDDMGRLINLRHLDTTGSPLVKMPPQMGNLTELQTLTDFVLGGVHDNASSIKELGKLQHLGGKLRISGLQNVANVKEVQEANLRCKEKLSELTFEWQRETKDTNGDREVLDALQPHINLKKLTICSYGGFNFPNWIGDSSFSKVVSIHLSDIKHCCSLPPFGQLPSLQELVIRGFPELEKIGAESYGERDGGAFPSLKRLSFENCPKLLIRRLHLSFELNSSWEGATVDTKIDKNLMRLDIEGVVGSSFPNWILELLFSNIVSIYLSGSRDCVSLPPLGQLPFLRKLVIRDFHELEKIGDEFYGNNPSVTPFRSLEFLSFKVMSKWKQWSFIRGERDGREFPSLKKLHLIGCPNLTGSLPNPDSLETLLISGRYDKCLPLDLSCRSFQDEQLCNKLEFPGSHRYVSVKEMNIDSCDGIKSLPLDYFPRLEKLTLKYCWNLESLTLSEEGGTEELHSLSYLEIASCKIFRSMPQPMQRLLPSLAILNIGNCPEIEPFPKGGLPSSLEELRIVGICSKLVAQYGHWDLQRLTSLKTLIFTGCYEVFDSFPGGLLPVSLTHLTLWYIQKLNGSAFQHVKSLQELNLFMCGVWLPDLPEQVLCPSLRSLEINGCPIFQPENEDWRKIFYIPNLKIGGWSRINGIVSDSRSRMSTLLLN